MFKTNTKEEPCNEGKEKGRCVLVYLLRIDKERRQYRGYLENVRDLAAAKQRLVADDTEEISLTEEIKIICGEDAVVLGKPLNRAWYDDNGKMVTVFAGTLMFVRREGRQLVNMRKKDVELIERSMKPIERIACGRVFTKPEDSLPEWEGRS